MNPKRSTNLSKINRFLFFKLPSAYWSGVRVAELSANYAEVTVRHSWFNSNPFASIFWAVQGMAAELSSGVLVMNEIQRSGRKISMLVVQNKAIFSKKAKGKIRFSCEAEDRVRKAVEQTVATGEGVTFWMQSTGVDAANDTVSTFDFEWSIRLKHD